MGHCCSGKASLRKQFQYTIGAMPSSGKASLGQCCSGKASLRKQFQYTIGAMPSSGKASLGLCPEAARLRCGNKNKMLISVQLYKNFKKGTNSICAHVPCAFRQGLSTNAKALPLSCVQCLFWPVHIVCHLALR